MSNDAANHSANAEGYRAKAAECASTVVVAPSPEKRSDAQKSERAYVTLAENEDWLAANSDKLSVSAPR